MKPLVSVIIPNYNYARFLGAAIDSVLAQTYENFEIIVVDDGSSDNTVEVVEAYGNRIKFCPQKNQGSATARNNGVKPSSGEFIAFLDADDIWLPEKLEKQVAKLSEDEEFGLVHCGMREFDSETDKTIHPHLQGEEGWVANDLLLFEKPVVIGGGSCLLIKREAFEAVGGFDTNFKKANSEDWDFIYRLARQYKIGFVPEILVDYRNHGKNEHFNIRTMEAEVRICFEKAFNTSDKSVLKFRRKAYGNLHTELAGGYFRAGDFVQFGKHLLKGLWLTPGNYRRFLLYPLRSLKRRRERKSIEGV